MVSYRLSPFLLEHTIGPEIVRGYYVYCWLDSGKVFYIGMGKERRAWNEHLEPAESIRQSSISFTVRILRDGMTKPIAHRYERFKISQFIAQGIPLINRKVPNVSSIKKT